MQVVDWLAKQASLHPEKLALQDLASGREISYRELNERASRVAALIKRWSLIPGSRVALLAYNSIEYVEWLYGCARAQSILVCLNWRLSANELTSIVQDAAPKALVYGQEFAEPAWKLAGQQGIACTMALGPEYETALARTDAGPPDWGWREESEPWYLLYIPGSQGKFKGAIQTFGMSFLNAVNDMLAIGLSRQDTFLSVLPFYHTSGLNIYLNPMLMVGGTTLIMRQFDPAGSIELLQTRADVFFGVPAIYRFISQQPEFARADFSRVRSWGCGGGAPIARPLFETWLERGVSICHGFGLTETGPTVFIPDPETAARKRETVGKPVGMMQCRVVDRHGLDCMPGERGELLIRGSGVTPGYWQMPEATAAAFTDGWLHTGDIAYVDDEGDYYIVDRIKNMYMTGGESVYPAEIENVLARMDEIAENGVFAVADERWGEVGKAVVALRPGMRANEDDIKAFCREQLAGFKVPQHVQIVPELPRNANGSIDKARLRQLYGK